MLAICASFRASSLIGSSSGLIITAHTSLYLFFLRSNCRPTYNSHKVQNEIFLSTLCTFSVLVWFTNLKLSTLGVRQPSHVPSDRLLFYETVVQPCIFAVMNCSVLWYCWYNFCSLQWHIFSLQRRVKRVRVDNMHVDAEEWRHGGSISPSVLS